MKNITTTIFSLFLITNLHSMEMPNPADDNYIDKVGEQWGLSLRQAIYKKDFNELVKLLEDRSLIETFTHELNRAFIHACNGYSEHINLKMMALFLTLDHVNINYYDQINNEGTPLVLSALNGHVNCLKFLLKQPEIDINIKCGMFQPRTALEWVTEANRTSDREKIIELLKNHIPPVKFTQPGTYTLRVNESTQATVIFEKNRNY